MGTKNGLKNNQQGEPYEKVRCSFIPARYVQLLLFSMIRGYIFGSRGILPFAIVAMTTENTSSNPNIPVYNWTTNSVILSSFYWSYAIIQFFACWISHAHGPKWYMAGAILIESAINLAIPLAADTLGPNGLMAFRVIQGFAQGMSLPLLAQLMGSWFPTNERTWMYSFVVLGTQAGPVIVRLTSGFIAASWAGWPAIFYLYGSVGMLVGITWSIFGYNKPAEHSHITKKESNHIQESLGQQNEVQVKSIPWRGIVKSLPFWAILAAAIGESWGSTLITTELPTYYAKVLSLDITKNGIFTTIASATSACAVMVFGPLIDFLINKNHISRPNARRTFNTIAFGFSAFCLMVVTYISSYQAVIAIFVIKSIGVPIHQHMVNMLDISPMFAGTLLGLANGFGQFVAIFAPLCVQFIVYDESDVTLWRTVFMLTAAIYIVADIIYVTFMSAERQWWDNSESKKIDLERRKSSIAAIVIGMS